jgi:hypothetical protein
MRWPGAISARQRRAFAGLVARNPLSAGNKIASADCYSEQSFEKACLPCQKSILIFLRRDETNTCALCFSLSKHQITF